MYRTTFVLAVIFMLLSGGGTGSYQKAKKSKTNHPPVIEKFDTTRRAMSFCPWSFQGGDCNRPDTRLSVIASDPDGDKLRYRYECTAGKVVGTGSEVTWILENTSRTDNETATVIVADGRGGESRASVEVLINVCGVCDRPPPACPEIEVLCPDQTVGSKSFKFKAKITGQQEGVEPPSFKWTVRWGNIVRGQFTDEIEVTSSDPEEELSATVEVNGIADPSCLTTASCSVKIKQPLP